MPEPRHAPNEVRISAVLLFVAVLIVVVGAVLAGVRIGLPPPAEPGWKPAAIDLPPVPRLQTDAPRDLRSMRAREEEALDGYGWVDRNAGIVRIPIDRAMDLLARRELPVRKEER